MEFLPSLRSQILRSLQKFCINTLDLVPSSKTSSHKCYCVEVMVAFHSCTDSNNLFIELIVCFTFVLLYSLLVLHKYIFIYMYKRTYGFLQMFVVNKIFLQTTFSLLLKTYILIFKIKLETCIDRTMHAKVKDTVKFLSLTP